MENLYMSPTIGKLSTALSKAQSVIEGAKKDAENPYFKSAYTTLASVWDACRKPLADNELSIIQLVEDGIDKVTIVTILSHSSGEFVQSRFSLKPKASDPQAAGSAVTYGRRYALSAIVGVCPTDDDAEMATSHAPVYKTPPKNDFEAQKHEIAGLLAKLHKEELKTSEDYKNAIKMLTGEDLVPENYLTIVEKMKILVAEKK